MNTTTTNVLLKLGFWLNIVVFVSLNAFGLLFHLNYTEGIETQDFLYSILMLFGYITHLVFFNILKYKIAKWIMGLTIVTSLIILIWVVIFTYQLINFDILSVIKVTSLLTYTQLSSLIILGIILVTKKNELLPLTILGGYLILSSLSYLILIVNNIRFHHLILNFLETLPMLFIAISIYFHMQKTRSILHTETLDAL